MQKLFTGKATPWAHAALVGVTIPETNALHSVLLH
jgi:hypothetical protein